MIYSQATPDTVFNSYFRTENGGWIAGDATYSIALPDDKTLWLFGDSFIGVANPDSSIAPGASFIRNCAMLQEGDSMTAVYNGTFEDPLDFVPTDVPDSAWFWPEHGMLENDTLKIFMSEFLKTEGTPGWNFAYDGLFLAQFSWPGLELLKLEEVMYYHDNEVRYGNQLMPVGDYTYIYGRKNLAQNVPYVHLARVPQGNLLGDWEFYNGSDWVSDPTQTVRISFEGVSQQYAAFEHQGKYILLTQGIWLSGNIHTLTADAPEGPFGNKTLIYSTPYPYPDMFTYNAWAHPQFNHENELLVSYNSNGDFWEIFNNVELYRPQFIRVPFEMIDSSFTYTGMDHLQYKKDDNSVIQRIYPNPVSDKVVIDYGLKEKTRVSVEIMDMTGRMITSADQGAEGAGNHQIAMDLSGFKPGVYILRILGESRMLIRK